jgi:hypothetical protein
VTTNPSQHPPSRRRRRSLLLAAVAVLTALLVPVLGVGSATAVSTTESNAAAAWLAGLVGSDGAAVNPDNDQPSLSGTVQVALALATNQSDQDTITRAMGYIGANVETYVVVGGVDNPGRLAYLLLLAKATGADPTNFGTTGTDLVARMEATYGAAEPGLYGAADIYSAAFNQSLAILGLVAVGATVPSEAVDWLLAQQCGAGTDSEGGWQPYRATVSGSLADCLASSGGSGADSNTTGLAVQALVATGADGTIGDALDFLASTQTAAAPTGGFGYSVGSAPDPNSTAIGIQALVAAGESPTGASWTVDGGTPYSSLVSWQITSGADAGALASPYSDGDYDFLATFQGLWGLAAQPFPLPVLPAPTPTTTTTAPGPSTTTTTVRGGGGASPVVVTPAFTG